MVRGPEKTMRQSKNLLRWVVELLVITRDVIIFWVNTTLISKNIHDGNASFVSFIDYLVRRQNGYYLSTLPSKYEGKKQNTNTINYLNLLQGRITKGSH